MKKVVNDKIIEAGKDGMEKHTGNHSEMAGATCNGNACGFVTVTATDSGGGCRFINNSDRPINMVVRFAFGFGCMGPSSFQIPANGFSDFLNGGYCSPYDANFA